MSLESMYRLGPGMPILLVDLGVRPADLLFWVALTRLTTRREISFLLAYEDPSSFYRAFRAWTGQTPEQARLAAD